MGGVNSGMDGGGDREGMDWEDLCRKVTAKSLVNGITNPMTGYGAATEG